VSGMEYVGQRIIHENKTSLEEMNIRWQEHINNANAGSYRDFQQAIREYGQENFKHEIIEDNILTVEETNEAEMFWIKWYNTKEPFGYNMTDGGEGVKRLKMSPESRNKMRLKKLGKKLGPHSEIHKQRLRASNKGKKRSKENIEKNRISHSFPILQYDANMNLIQRFNSIGEASKATKIKGHIIVNNAKLLLKCDKKNKFIWRYENDTHRFKHTQRNKRMIVYQFDLFGKLINEYDVTSYQELQKILNIPIGTILNYCKCIYTRNMNKYLYILSLDKNIDVINIKNKIFILNKEQVIRTRRCINQYDLNMNLIATYQSVDEAARITNINYTSIISCAKLRYKSSGGFIWRYVD
jgi:group I intron endonuclease